MGIGKWIRKTSLTQTNKDLIVLFPLVIRVAPIHQLLSKKEAKVKGTIRSLFTVSNTSTATVYGLFNDSETNNPIAGAKISLEGSSVSALTDVNGHYTLPALPFGTLNMKAYHF